MCWSLLTREKRIGVNSNGKLKLLTIEVLAGRYYANPVCELFARRYPDQYVRLRYADLAPVPVETMSALMAKVLPFERWDSASIGAQDNHHQLNANRMRTEALTLGVIILDDAWRREMPERLRTFVQRLTAPLRAKYGYEALKFGL